MAKRILLVEDDAAIMDTLSLFLKYESYEVIKARSVAQTLAMLADEKMIKPDLVLLDYMLQDDTAEPVVSALRAKYRSEVVIALLTAADDPASKGKMVGADLTLAKPFELEVLLNIVRESLEQRSFYNEVFNGVVLEKNESHSIEKVISA